jgi:hypothetical protein
MSRPTPHRVAHLSARNADSPMDLGFHDVDVLKRETREHIMDTVAYVVTFGRAPEDTRLAKLEIDHPGAVSAMPVRERHDALPQIDVVVRCTPITQGARAHADGAQGAPLAHALEGQVPHQLAPGRCGHHFFRRASLVILTPSLPFVAFQSRVSR